MGAVSKLSQIANPAMRPNDTGLLENAHLLTRARGLNTASGLSVRSRKKSGSVAR